MITRVQRIGILGGAFDPPHLTHAALAQIAIAQLQLDKLLVIPTGQAWHKTRRLTASAHRMAMAAMAFAGSAQVVVDPREVLRPGPSYTVDTLRELKLEYPIGDFFLLLGADQVRALPSWQLWHELLKYATICVACRAIDQSQNALFGLIDFAALCQPIVVAGGKVLQLGLPPNPQSSTQIRQLASQRIALDDMVNPAVASYIAQHHLYREP